MKKLIIAIAALATLSTASLARTDVDPRDRAAGDINTVSSAAATGGSANTTQSSALAIGDTAGETAFARMTRLHNEYELGGH